MLQYVADSFPHHDANLCYTRKKILIMVLKPNKRKNDIKNPRH